MEHKELVAIERGIWEFLRKHGVSLQDALLLFTRMLGHVDDTIRDTDGPLPEYEKIKSRYKHGS